MHITHNNNDLLMQRLTTAAPIHEATLTTYEETVGIIHRHLPPSLALQLLQFGNFLLAFAALNLA